MPVLSVALQRCCQIDLIEEGDAQVIILMDSIEKQRSACAHMCLCNICADTHTHTHTHTRTDAHTRTHTCTDRERVDTHLAAGRRGRVCSVIPWSSWAALNSEVLSTCRMHYLWRFISQHVPSEADLRALSPSDTVFLVISSRKPQLSPGLQGSPGLSSRMSQAHGLRLRNLGADLIRPKTLNLSNSLLLRLRQLGKKSRNQNKAGFGMFLEQGRGLRFPRARPQRRTQRALFFRNRAGSPNPEKLRRSIAEASIEDGESGGWDLIVDEAFSTYTSGFSFQERVQHVLLAF